MTVRMQLNNHVINALVFYFMLAIFLTSRGSSEKDATITLRSFIEDNKKNGEFADAERMADGELDRTCASGADSRCTVRWGPGRGDGGRRCAGARLARSSVRAHHEDDDCHGRLRGGDEGVGCVD